MQHFTVPRLKFTNLPNVLYYRITSDGRCNAAFPPGSGKLEDIMSCVPITTIVAGDADWVEKRFLLFPTACASVRLSGLFFFDAASERMRELMANQGPLLFPLFMFGEIGEYSTVGTITTLIFRRRQS